MSRVLVIGATGNQGGAVVRSALAEGHSVVAFTRDPNGEKEQALVVKGVELASGSLEDTDSIVKAATGVDAMFAMTTPFAGLETEVRYGRNIADAVKTASVPFLVFSSVADANKGTGIGHFESKWEIEKRIAEIGIPATVVAPVFFMDNFLFPANTSDIAAGNLHQALETKTPLQMITANDIGRFVAKTLSEPSRFIGKRIDIAGDELTGPEMASVLSEATGRNVEYRVQPYEELEALGADWRRMYEWFNEGGFTADRQQLAADYPDFEFETFKGWARSQPWDRLLTPQTIRP